MYYDWPRLTRCCFCIPLRRGVLALAYINLFFSAFTVGLYSYTVHYAFRTILVLAGRSVGLVPAEVCLVFYCLEVVFNAILIYGAHKKLPKYVQAFYYYTIVTCVALIVLQTWKISHVGGLVGLANATFLFTGVCLEIYLIVLVRSLVQDLEESGPHAYENRLYSIANEELDLESNGIYNNTTAIPIDAID